MNRAASRIGSAAVAIVLLTAGSAAAEVAQGPSRSDT